MIDRLRLLLDRPLDPAAARAVVALASAILLGSAAVFVLGVSERGRPATSHKQIAQPPRVAAAPVEEIAPNSKPRSPRRRQDPQDERASAAGRRAARALQSHRALQHVPYRDGGLTVALVGARGSRAVLRVSAPTIPAARRGWHRFLRRYKDSGRSYVPVFKAAARHSGTRGGA
jgi:hypothetical protein